MRSRAKRSRYNEVGSRDKEVQREKRQISQERKLSTDKENQRKIDKVRKSEAVQVGSIKIQSLLSAMRRASALRS